jgi:hypothetical protein
MRPAVVAIDTQIRWLLMPSHDKLPWETSTLRTAIARMLEQYERGGRVSDCAW